MARWTDIAEWRGPTVNRVTGGMVEWRGLVVHIAEGYYEGTIAYQKNPASQVSSHFVVDFDGKLAQVVDTADTAWTQIAGNGHWLSVECAGFTPNALTQQQVETIAGLFAKCHAVYGVPLQVAINPDGRGLGHHSMGTNGHSVPTDTWTGPTWGHTDCPGPAIVAQKPEIVALAGGGDMANIADADWQALIYRVEALINNRPTVAGGPTAGEVNALHDAIAALSGGTAPPVSGAVDLTDASVAKVADATAQELHDRLAQ